MTKRDKIIELSKKGKTKNEIAHELKTYYSYVSVVIKNYKRDNELETLKK